MGVDSSDSFYSFLTFMDAYNVKLVDDNGKLLVDDPKVRQGLIGALSDYTAPYTKGCTPPSSTSWKDPDNNVSVPQQDDGDDAQRHDFHRRQMARCDANNDKLPADQRELGRKSYYELIRNGGIPQQARRHQDGLTARP